MAQLNVKPPNLPLSPEIPDRRYMDDLNNVLRLFFNQITNNGPMGASSQNVGDEKVVTALTLSQPDPENLGNTIISLPTQADFANLRSGDVYYDTSGGVATSYPLRIKA
jgi:hypothetical protein